MKLRRSCLLVLALMVVVACSGPGSGSAPAVVSVSLVDGPRSVAVGSTLALSATVVAVGGASEAVSWSSGDSAIATVSGSGDVTGVAVGAVQVMAASVVDPSQFGVATVTVLEAQSIEGVTINEPGVTLAVGGTADFTATVVATGNAGTSVVWSSSEAAVASVSAAGRVMAVSPGVAVITATSEFDASKSGTVAVAVELRSEESGVPASISVVSGDGQSASAGTVVAIAPSVRVRDSGGSPLAGTSVTFSVAAGGGSITPTSAVTADADGIARLDGWVLGTTAGTNNLRAMVTGSSPSISTSLSAVGTPGAASAVTSTVGVSPTSLVANGTATSDITVRLKDAFGNDLTSGGAAVSFVTPSIGSIGGVTNNGDGTYSAKYTAGTTAGTVTITPRVAGLAFTNTSSITLSTAPAVLSLAIDQSYPSVVAGNVLSLTASVVTIAGASGVVDWSSGDTSIATIDTSSGALTGVSDGVTTVTATSVFDPTRSDAVAIHVSARIVRVSVGSSGQQSNGHSSSPSISGAGRFVSFSSSATNLTTEGVPGVFLHDRELGTTRLVSGAVPVFGPNRHAVSANGEYVAYGLDQIYVMNIANGTTELVSVASDGTPGDGPSTLASISATGRYVVFLSEARNLDSIDGWRGLFVRDRATGTTERVSVDSEGTQHSDFLHGGSISADGRYVAFSSERSVMPEKPGRDYPHYSYLRDRQFGRTTRLLVDSDFECIDCSWASPTISEDGSSVAFPVESRLFVHDTRTGSYEAIPNIADVDSIALSRDGRYLAFATFNEDPIDDESAFHNFVYDRVTRTTTSLGDGVGVTISGDGRYAAFTTWLTGLVEGDTNGARDVFVFDLCERGGSCEGRAY